MGATATRTANRWVVCDDYAAGPYNTAGAQSAKARHDAATACAEADHRIVVADRKPVTVADVRTMYADWSQPCLADPGDELALDERTAQTRELAAAILALPLRTRLGDMVLVSAGWSKETGEKADAIAEPGTPEWIASLGAHEHATMTADGRGAIRDAWCLCGGQAGEPEVPYEAWTADGRIAHGYVCPACRKVAQTG